MLTLYTPVIEFEERVPTTFITTVKVSGWKFKSEQERSLVSFSLYHLFTLYILGAFERQSRVNHLDDGCQDDLFHHLHFHTLLCGSGDHPDPC